MAIRLKLRQSARLGRKTLPQDSTRPLSSSDKRQKGSGKKDKRLEGKGFQGKGAYPQKAAKGEISPPQKALLSIL
jgi:hypothetical protein